MISEVELRSFVGHLIRREIPVSAPLDEVLDALAERIEWLENAWRACHDTHVAQERAAWNLGILIGSMCPDQHWVCVNGCVVTGDPRVHQAECTVTAPLGGDGGQHLEPMTAS